MASDEREPMFERAVIVGVGLIGASLARAFREFHLAKEIIGTDADDTALARALEIGVVDETAPLPDAVANADLVVIATPVGSVGAVAKAVGDAASPGALIIDVGSVKGAVAAAASVLPDNVFFVPCHPISGTEQSGPDAGFATLFQNRWAILTPLARSDAPYLAAVEKAKALWEGVGSDVEIMTAEHHDLALAVTSHIPHLIAFTLVGAADDLESVAETEVVKYSAGGFRDFTRIAASNPVMWRDVFLNNKEAVLEVLGRFSEELAAMQKAIRWGDGEALHQAFERSRSVRQAIIEAGQETDKPNFGRDDKD